MRQSLNGRASRCANNARTVEWAGSAVSVLPAFLPIRAPLTSGFRKSESSEHENPNFGARGLVQGVRLLRTNMVQSNLTPCTKGLTFKTSLRLAPWSKPQVNAILLPYRTVLYSA